jgi:hypothetical protein
MDPNPPVLLPLRIPVQQAFHRGPRLGSVPPGTDRDQRVAHFHTVTVHVQPGTFHSVQPLADGFVGRRPGVTVVIARTDKQARLFADSAQVFFDHDDLNLQVQRGPQIEQITADDDRVKTPGIGRQPVKLLQGIMQVGYKEESQGGVEAAESDPSRPSNFAGGFCRTDRRGDRRWTSQPDIPDVNCFVPATIAG